MYSCNFVTSLLDRNLISIERLDIDNNYSCYVYYNIRNGSYIFSISGYNNNYYYRDYVSKDWHEHFTIISDGLLLSRFNMILSYYRKAIRKMLEYLPHVLSDVVYGYLV